MSQYGDYNDKIFQSSHNNSFQNSSNSQSEFIDFNNNFSFTALKVANIEYQQKAQKDKQLLPETNLSNFQNIQIVIQNNIRTNKILEINNFGKKAYLESKKGYSQQTVDLNINFKTLFCRFMKELIVLKLLDKRQKQLFLQYKNQNPNFLSLKKFIHKKQNHTCKKYLLRIMESSQIIKCILSSCLQQKNKLKMLKFIQVMRNFLYQSQTVNQWKPKNY